MPPWRPLSSSSAYRGLALALASQSLGGLGERLRDTILTNAATIALLSPGAEDLRGLARLFAPVSADELAAMARFEVVLRMPGPQGCPTVYGGIVAPPGAPDPATAAAIVAESDRRDARTFWTRLISEARSRMSAER